jgi:hypothetical protein
MATRAGALAKMTEMDPFRKKGAVVMMNERKTTGGKPFVRVTDQNSEIDMETVCRELQSSYWAKDRTREIILESINSL